MKKIRIAVMAFCLLVPAFVAAAEETIEGKIQGYNCVALGGRCASDFEDPVVNTEVAFVLDVGDKNYYFVPNVDRIQLYYLVGKKVRITGVVNKDKKSIQAGKIEDIRNGDWKIVYVAQ